MSSNIIRQVLRGGPGDGEVGAWLCVDVGYLPPAWRSWRCAGDDGRPVEALYEYAGWAAGDWVYEHRLSVPL